MKVDFNEIRMRRGIFLLPNLLTTCCLFGGFYAIVAAIDGNFERATIAIFVAMIFDGLDGRVARIAEYGSSWGRFGWIAAFFFAAATALRLARFNARSATQDKRYFEGLPSPSGAAIVAAFVALAHQEDITGLPGLILAFVITLLAATLMVSKFPYRSFKDRAAGERVRYSKLLLVPLVIALIAINPPIVLFTMFSIYALSGPTGWSWLKLRRRPREAAQGGEGS